ncbi:potassium channel family protein [Demequina aurantiaca]|uniref:potassium channel family protein n=1 Tax=Demequina aurantiaca TaxID=676200 RepID=UPI000784B2FD|nr:potassium channel family protein [Demequina aurantiaca]
MSQRGTLWVLFGCLVLLQFGYPVTAYGPWWTVGYLLLYSGVIFYGAREIAIHPRAGWPIVPGVILLVGAAVWFALNQGEKMATVILLGAVGIFQLMLLVILIRRLLQPSHHAHTIDMLLIAVSAYLLLGGVFGVIASQLEFAAAGSYIDATSAEPVTWQSLFYGSYVTISTLGYGDIVPKSDWARSLGSLEAVLGTLFVAVVIARLVGLGGSRWRKDEPAVETESA